MTKKEVEKFLGDTKVYVDGKSAAIQRKLFSFGYHWANGEATEVRYPDSPFLFIYRNKEIFHSTDMIHFSSHDHRKITANKILSLEITEPSYRAFKSKEECWEEMHKHPDFGWLRRIDSGVYVHISGISQSYIIFDSVTYNYQNAFKDCTFIDGYPFGIKEE